MFRQLARVELPRKVKHPSRANDLSLLFDRSQCDVELDERNGIVYVYGLKLEGNATLPKAPDGSQRRERTGRHTCVHLSMVSSFEFMPEELARNDIRNDSQHKQGRR